MMERGKFPGPLTITEIDVDLELWRLEEDLVYDRGAWGTITTPKGFHSNAASIPAPFRITMPRWGKWRRPAVQHDYWYWYYRAFGNWGVIQTRLDADKIFSEALWSVGVSGSIQGSMFAAVRLGGAFKSDTPTTRLMDKLNAPLAETLKAGARVTGIGV